MQKAVRIGVDSDGLRVYLSGKRVRRLHLHAAVTISDRVLTGLPRVGGCFEDMGWIDIEENRSPDGEGWKNVNVRFVSAKLRRHFRRNMPETSPGGRSRFRYKDKTGGSPGTFVRTHFYVSPLNFSVVRGGRLEKRPYKISANTKVAISSASDFFGRIRGGCAELRV